MSDDWDTVVKIGSKAGPGGGGGPREKTIKGKSQLNAAMRTGGILATEKKYGSANATSSSGSGQFLTKVDRSDDIVKPKTGDSSVKDLISCMQTRLGVNRKAFAVLARVPVDKLNEIESNKPADQQVLDKIESTFGIYVRGAMQGQKKGKRPNKHHEKLFQDGTTVLVPPKKK